MRAEPLSTPRTTKLDDDSGWLNRKKTKPELSAEAKLGVSLLDVVVKCDAAPVAPGPGVAWRGVAWRGVAWRGVAWRGTAAHATSPASSSPQ